MTEPEFSRPIDVRQADGRTVELEASEAERTALAARFDLVRIDSLDAEVTVDSEGPNVAAQGRLHAQIVQSCAISGEDLAVTIDEPLSLRFVPASAQHRPDEEVELEAGELDEIEFTGTSFDLGEAVAQSLALAIDPFAVGPQAEETRRAVGMDGEQASGPFAALAALKKDKPEG